MLFLLVLLLFFVCGVFSSPVRPPPPAAKPTSVNFPPLPKDGSTPYQQRLAVYSPNGENISSHFPFFFF